MNLNDTLIAPALKVCKKCGIEKPLNRFYQFKSGKRTGMIVGTCFDCEKSYKRARVERLRGEPAPFVILPSEEWRSVPGFVARYDVSNLGRVRSWYNSRGPLKVPRIKATFAEPKDGYICVALYANNHRTKHIGVARLVLMAFLGLPESDLEASHLDGDITNNTLPNLAWETRLENEQHKVEHGTRPMGESQHASKLKDEQVREIRRLRQQGVSPFKLAERFGVGYSTIHKVCKRETWTHVA